MRNNKSISLDSFKIWVNSLKQFTAYLWKNIRVRINTFPIRFKLMIIIALIVFSTVLLLSFIVYWSGRNILMNRLQDTCNLLANNLSEYTREEMLLERADPVARDRIQYVVLRFSKLDIEGFKYAAVVTREGQVIAHTDYHRRGTDVTEQDRTIITSLKSLYWHAVGDSTYEYFQPIFVRKKSDDSTINVLLGAAIVGFSKRELSSPVREVQNVLIVAVIFVVIISAGVIFFVAKRMTGQINELSNGARKVGSGNLDMYIPVRSRDELGLLAEDFNLMIRQLRERLHMQKFVSKLTVEMIRKRAAMGDPPEQGGDTREVTILFSDVRNFTSITESLRPEEIVELINIYHDLQAQIIENNGGVVDKFIGDQVMGIFLGENMADNSIKAAIKIQRAIRALNTRKQKLKEVLLTVGMGLSDGTAIVGNMGSKNRMDYTVIGDVVNLANRLCSVAKPGQIIASMKLVQNLTGIYPIIRLNPILVKGKKQPVDVFEIDYDRAIII